MTGRPRWLPVARGTLPPRTNAPPSRWPRCRGPASGRSPACGAVRSGARVRRAAPGPARNRQPAVCLRGHPGSTSISTRSSHRAAIATGCTPRSARCTARWKRCATRWKALAKHASGPGCPRTPTATKYSRRSSAPTVLTYRCATGSPEGIFLGRPGLDGGCGLPVGWWSSEAAGGDVAVGGGRVDVELGGGAFGVLERVVDPAVGGACVQGGGDSGADRHVARLGA